MESPEEKNFYISLPKKRMSAGVLFFDENERVLLVKPNYKEGWGVPGGIVDEGESPLCGAVREIQEEIALSISKETLSLVCLNYIPENGIKTEALHFMFYAGVLSVEQIQNIVLQEEELLEYRFFEKKEAVSLLSNPVLGNRVRVSFEAIEKKTFYYIES